MPPFAEKLAISAAGIPRRRSRCHNFSARPVRTVDFWIVVRNVRTAAGRPPTNTQAATSSPRRGRRKAGVVTVADDQAAEDGSDDLAECRNRCQRAEPADARERALCLGHDALAADGARHVPDAQRGGGEREHGNRLHDNKGESTNGGDGEPEHHQDRRVVSLGPPAEADGEQHRRHGEACGRQANGGAVGAEGQKSIRRHRARQGNRHLQ